MSEMYKNENFSDVYFRNNFYEYNKLFKNGFIFKFEKDNDFNYKIKIKKQKKIKVKNKKLQKTKKEWSNFFKKLNTGRKHLNRKSPQKTSKIINHLKKLHNFNKTKVKKIDLNGIVLKEYNSIKEAAEDNNAKYQAIVRVCLGKRKTAYGYKWRYC